MQLVKANRDALLKPLQVVSGIVERRQTLPILANILVRKEGGKVSFTATDLEIQIQTSADIGTGTETAATTIAARKLVDILRALPDADVQLSLTNKKMAVRAARAGSTCKRWRPKSSRRWRRRSTRPIFRCPRRR